MADKLGQLYVEIIADNKKFDSGIDKSKKETEKFDKGLGNLSGTVKKLLGAGALIALAKKIVDVGKASINAASDAEETQNKFNVVFSGISGYANDMAEQLAVAYGTSISGAKDMLAGTGDLLTGLGFTQESAFDLSEQVLTLGADLASFTNYSGGAEGASEALTKALLGEREMLKGLGISINEADVKAQMLLDSQNGLTFETDKQAKAQATLTLAMSQTANAQGDFARSSDSYANQLKIAKARTEDLQVELGRALLPTATKGIGIFSELTGKLGAYIKSLNDVKAAEDAQASGIATKEQDLLLIQQKIDAENKVLEAAKNRAIFDKEEFGKVIERTQQDIDASNNRLLYLSRLAGEKKREINNEAVIAEKIKETAQAEADKAQAEEEYATAKKKQQEDQLSTIEKIQEANKTDIEIIDEQIEQIENFTDLDAEAKEKQLEALKILQEEKNLILEEDAESERVARENKALAEEEARLARLEAEKIAAEESKKIQESKQTAILDSISNITSAVQGLYQIELNNIESTKNSKIDALDKELLGEEAYAAEVKKIEDQAAIDSWKVEKELYDANKLTSTLEAGINTALGVTAALASAPPPFNIALAATTAAAGAVQIGVIQSQPAPKRPKLATGAVIAGSQRGVDVTVGEAGNSELILGGGAKGLPLLKDFAKAIVGEMGTGQKATQININSLYPPNRRDLDRLAKDLYTSNVKEQQRRGI